MADANQEYLDAVLRHQIGLRRYTAGEVRRILRLIEKADQDLSAKIRKKLADLAGKPLDLTSKRLQKLLMDIKAAREALMKELRTDMRAALRDLSRAEAEFEAKVTQHTIPVAIDYAAVPAATLDAVINTKPFAGGANAARTLAQWFDGLRTTDQSRLIEAIQLGLTQGETVDQIMRRIAGTKAKQFTDGALAMTRRNAEAVARTAINHVSNAAREAFLQENEDIILGYQWVSTLDGRTSAICRARDGCVAAVGDKKLPAGVRRLDPPSARPPAHPNCRSTMVAVFDFEGVAAAAGTRPQVTDTRTRAQREKDFRADAKAAAGDKWSKMTPPERTKAAKRFRDAWAKDNIGTVPDNVDYNTWLRRQPAKFQDEVLGKTKGALFRRGGLTLDQFLDRAGQELTLDELKARWPEAWSSANL